MTRRGFRATSRNRNAPERRCTFLDYRVFEFCGACFDPSGKVLFVNIQTPGITFAVWGPWGRGTL